MKTRRPVLLVVVTVVAAAVLAAGCGTASRGRGRGVAAGLLIGLATVAIGSTVATAVVSNDKEDKLREDVQAGTLSGREFAERDEEGKRWNRAARASAFVAGVAVVGLLILGEVTWADQYEYGPVTPPASKPIIPGLNPEPPPTVRLPGR